MFYPRPTPPPLVFHTTGECTACGGTGTIPPPDICECDWSGCGCVARPCTACGRDATMRRLRALRDDARARAVDACVCGSVYDAAVMLRAIDDIIAGRDPEDHER